jgi:hypothetical protein
MPQMQCTDETCCLHGTQSSETKVCQPNHAQAQHPGEGRVTQIYRSSFCALCIQLALCTALDQLLPKCSATFCAENLKRKRKEFEEQNRDAIREQQRLAETRRRREDSMNNQRELLAHILKHHSSYYELLMVCSSDAVMGCLF